MGREWSRLSTTGRMFECRSIDFEKSFAREKISSCFPKSTLSYEHRTKFIVHRHIEITLSIAIFIIFESMELLRKWTDRFREKCELRYKESEFSLVGIKKLSLHSDEVTEIDEFFCEFVSR